MPNWGHNRWLVNGEVTTVRPSDRLIERANDLAYVQEVDRIYFASIHNGATLASGIERDPHCPLHGYTQRAIAARRRLMRLAAQ